MIVVDTSALIAIALGEGDGPACEAAIVANERVLLSAGTASEVRIVASRRGVTTRIARMLEAGGFEVVPVTAITAERVAKAHERWGKGRHPAALNFGDCFAYALADERNCPLLFIGNDFSRTDIASAMAAKA